MNNNERDLNDMDLELTIKSSLKVRTTVRGKGSTRNHTLSRMVLGCDSSLTYSANPIKIEKECSDSPYGYSRSSISPSHHTGVFTNSSSLISDFCFSSLESKTVAMKTFFEGDLGKDSLTSWTTKHPQNWTKKEVLDWVYYVVEQEKLDGSCVKGEAFSNLTGSSLIEMGKEGFLDADPINGLKLYQTFRNLINNVVIEEPRRAPPYSSLDTFNQENHLDVKKLTQDIISGVYGDPRGNTHNNPTIQGPASGLCKLENSFQICSRPPFPNWRPNEKTRRNSCHGLPLNNTVFDGSGNNKGNTGDSNDLTVYHINEDKIVGLHGLGAYPIDKDFSPWLSLLPDSFSTSSAFSAPLSQTSSSSKPHFDFLEQSVPQPLTPAGSSAPLTPPLSHRGSLSSPTMSCLEPSPTWFPQQLSPTLFSVPRTSNGPRRQHSNTSGSDFQQTILPCPNLPSGKTSSSCPRTSNGLKRQHSNISGGSDFQQTILPCPNLPSGKSSTLCPSGANGIPTPSHSLTNLIPQKIPAHPSSYHFHKTKTTTLCRQNGASAGHLRQQMQSHTFSSSWTISSSSLSSSSSPSSSLLEQQDKKFSGPPVPSLSSSSSPVWHENNASLGIGEPSSSYIPSTVGPDSMEDSLYRHPIDEEDLTMDYDPVSTGEVRNRAPRRNRNKSSKTGNHLWEFVRDLLRDPKFNPKLLKWEDKENGIFRFVQSEQVARLWGEKKNNPMMTYEKLSRAMRFCRKTGFFNAVPRTGKFPKKLCFMFGEKAHGWKD